MKSNYSLRNSLLALIALGAVVPVFAEDYFDDIYFDPRKPAKSQTSSKKSSAYIADFDQMDVDAYNRRGQYYISPVDTIGLRTENGEDFVYTQQIQKFYNPRIIVNNSDVLKDILDYSYGNVEIIYNAYGPAFAGWGWNDWYYNPYSFVWGPTWPISPNDWRWALMTGPNLSWSWSWGWGPSLSWSWNFGPAWGWGPSWSWGWGPSWGYGPGWGYPGGIGWGPAYPPARPMAQYRPNGRRPNNPGSHWATTRPGAAGGNYTGGIRPGGPNAQGNNRPGSNAVRPDGNVGNYTPNGNATRPGRYTFGGSNASASTGSATPTRNEASATSVPRGSRGQGATTNGRVTSGSSTVSTSRNSSSNSSNRYNSNSSGSSNRYNSNSSNSSSSGRYSSGSNSSSSGRYSTGSSSSGRYSSGSAGRSSGGGASRGGGGGRGSRR